MALQDRHVVVVGAGIGGATVALLCARAGARVTLFEAAPEPHTVGAGILLQPNGLAVLYGLDLDERLAHDGQRVSELRVADPTGQPILVVPIPHFAEGLDHALVLRRSALLAALLDLLRAEPSVECRFDDEVVDASPDGTVTHRGPSGRRVLAGDLVVGADGVHSRIRKRGHFGVHTGRGVWYVRGLGPEHLVETLTEYWTDAGIFGVAPVRHGTYFYASAGGSHLAAAIEQRDLGYLREIWARALPIAGEVLGGVARFEDLVVNQVIRVDCQRWVDGRLVLLGDAAHAMSPNLGQGAGSALVDAAVLAWELDDQPDLPAALARYTERRRIAVRAVQDMAARLAFVSEIGSPPLRWLRDGILRLLGGWLGGEVPMRLVEQTDPAWLRMVAERRG